jgi:hypothetical protein
MGRPAKLTPEQLVQIEQRLLAGESAEKLGPEFGVSGAAIRKRFGSDQTRAAQSSEVRAATNQLVQARIAIAKLPPAHRSVVFSLADLAETVLTVSGNNARTGIRAAALANSEMAKVDDADPMGEKSLNVLKGVASLVKLSNDACATGINLLNANKDRLREGTPDEPDPSALPADAVEAAAVYQRIMQGG